ncbi:hypothetical protein G7047_29305 [Diaphorobacter sp. HDW4A]|uniref:hypothetical protein n=1 Tax=Diaphorobacter sp. HDW4A TaxID=2714924 RepID=UPI001408B067|nr:hypothetical protein [Diaphorobacter sp. HDW4A]QIL80824.1 hypothetical protein G7047_13600 [Diaphorobacter sp. HDW4A]QIL83579.1 hypothetical protein G7047_29305 [Diaphorobacter sp. HDW4A]
MKRILLLIAIAVALIGMSGCTVVPAQSAASGCRLLNIALDEADMASAWYEEAGDVLEECGMTDARERAAFKACLKDLQDEGTRACYDM